MTRVKTTDAKAALNAILAEQAKAAAGNNTLVSHAEAKGMDPVLQKADAAIRTEGGAGTRVKVDALVERATTDAVATWGQFNANNQGPDGVWLSNAEAKAIAQADPALGALTEQALLRVRRGAGPTDPVAGAKTFLARADFSNRAFKLPGGIKLDARPGFPDRAGVPATVLAGFDHYFRAEDADWATARLFKGTVNGADGYAVYVTTDGDDEYVELYDSAGQGLASARLWAGEDFTPDPFFGRGRLAAVMTNLDRAPSEDGMSEPLERAAEGQTPQNWPGDVKLIKGELTHDSGRLMNIDLPSDLAITKPQLEVATAALELVFAKVLTHRTTPGQPLLLGPQYDGTLSVGNFTRSTDGKTYEAAYWKDIDDASYVFYFTRTPAGQLKLASEQFDN